MNYHVEVHSKDRQVEHYIVQDCGDHVDVRAAIQVYYELEKGVRIGEMVEVVLNDTNVNYYVFRIVELKPDPVVFISGEYRPAYPL